MASNGIVCFMDILGYSKFIENNSIEYVLHELRDVLKNHPELLRADIINKLSDSPKISDINEIEEIYYSRQKWFVLSDTIIVTVSFDDADKRTRFGLWWTLIVWAISIFENLFKNGLPCRAAIDFGNYHYEKYDNGLFLAGETFAKCHKLSNSLNAACMVMSDKAVKVCKADIDDPGDEYLNRMLISLNNLGDDENREYNVVGSWNPGEIEVDLKTYITKKFSEHNKPINKREVKEKIENTEIVMRSQINNRQQYINRKELGL